MPQFNQQRMKPMPAWFERLPRRSQIVLLMLLVLVPAVIAFLSGMHCIHTGKPILLNNTRLYSSELFLFTAACLAIEAGLFAVLMGWARSSVPDPRE